MLLALVLLGGQTVPLEVPAVPETWTGAAGYEMVRVPAGDFVMGGLPGAWTERETRISAPFYLGRTEVTQALWSAVMGTSTADLRDAHNAPCARAGVGETRPAACVSWRQAIAFANRLSEREGLTPCYEEDALPLPRWTEGLRCPGYRLPTEAEWEHAARAGRRLAWAGSDYVGDVAWYDPDKHRSGLGWSASLSAQPVATKAPNRWGLYDMSGNVWEWVWDAWSEEYLSLPAVDPVDDSEHWIRVIRGGSWGSSKRDVQVASRDRAASKMVSPFVGLRLARSVGLPD